MTETVLNTAERKALDALRNVETPATASEVEPDMPNSAASALVKLYDKGVVDRRQRPSDKRGPDPYEYWIVED